MSSYFREKDQDNHLLVCLRYKSAAKYNWQLHDPFILNIPFDLKEVSNDLTGFVRAQFLQTSQSIHLNTERRWFLKMFTWKVPAGQFLPPSIVQ